MADCSKAEDWRKPRNAQNTTWTSKVDWDVYERINPRANPNELAKFRALNAEVRASRAYDISVQGIQERLRSKANKAKKAAEAAKNNGKVAKSNLKALQNGGVGDGGKATGKGAGKPGGKQKLMDKTADGRTICYKWNFGKPCVGNPCPHQHVCRACGGDHPMTDPTCPKKA